MWNFADLYSNWIARKRIDMKKRQPVLQILSQCFAYHCLCLIRFINKSTTQTPLDCMRHSLLSITSTVWRRHIFLFNEQWVKHTYIFKRSNTKSILSIYKFFLLIKCVIRNLICAKLNLYSHLRTMSELDLMSKADRIFDDRVLTIHRTLAGLYIIRSSQILLNQSWFDI